MTDQLSQNTTISPDEISAAFAQSFGTAVGRLTFEKLQLERQVQALHADSAEAEAALINLKQENSNLITNHIQLEGLMHSLEKELEGRPTPEDIMAFETAVEALEIKIGELVSAGPTLAQSAAADVIKTEARNEKAAPD